jgi:hypothetical protein
MSSLALRHTSIMRSCSERISIHTRGWVVGKRSLGAGREYAQTSGIGYHSSRAQIRSSVYAWIFHCFCAPADSFPTPTAHPRVPYLAHYAPSPHHPDTLGPGCKRFSGFPQPRSASRSSWGIRYHFTYFRSSPLPQGSYSAAYCKRSFTAG